MLCWIHLLFFKKSFENPLVLRDSTRMSAIVLNKNTLHVFLPSDTEMATMFQKILSKNIKRVTQSTNDSSFEDEIVRFNKTYDEVSLDCFFVKIYFVSGGLVIKQVHIDFLMLKIDSVCEIIRDLRCIFPFKYTEKYEFTKFEYVFIKEAQKLEIKLPEEIFISKIISLDQFLNPIHISFDESDFKIHEGSTFFKIDTKRFVTCVKFVCDSDINRVIRLYFKFILVFGRNGSISVFGNENYTHKGDIKGEKWQPMDFFEFLENQHDEIRHLW